MKHPLSQRLYFTGRLHRGFLALFIAKDLFRGLAISMLGLFFPIFIYVTTGEDFLAVAFFFIISHILYFLTVPFGGKFLGRFGFRNSLIFSGLLSAAFYGMLIFANEANIFKILPFVLVALVLFRLFFWLPYHVDFATFSDHTNRGREVSAVLSTISFLGIIGPITAGYIVQTSGFPALFLVGVILLLFGTAAYLFVPQTNQKYSWSYKTTWAKLFDKRHRAASYALVAVGAESSIALVVWPIFIYKLLQGDVLEVGLLSTAIISASIVVQLVFGRYIDHQRVRKDQLLRWGSILYALGWILKIFIFTATQIFVIGLYHNITKIFARTSFDTLIYDMTADQGHYIDEFTVLREMAIHIGKLAGMVVSGVLFIFVGLEWAFILAALAALAFNFIAIANEEKQGSAHVSSVNRL